MGLDFDCECFCNFCGRTWTRKWIDSERKKLSGCENCTVSPMVQKGEKVKYDAPQRRLSSAIYADNFLKRGEIYTVVKTSRWQHGTFLYLEGFGNRTFDLWIFTPADYRKFNETKVEN